MIELNRFTCRGFRAVLHAFPAPAVTALGAPGLLALRTFGAIRHRAVRNSTVATALTALSGMPSVAVAQTHNAWYQTLTVPEPNGYTMVLCGLAVLAAVAWRQRRPG